MGQGVKTSSELDDYWMRAAKWTGENYSKDRSRKVGCVIVSKSGRLHGANHFPDGVEDLDERHEKPEKYFWTEHAERNAIYEAARVGLSTSQATMYVSWFPCMDCARAIVQSGISTLVAHRPDLSDPKWGEDFQRVGQLLREGGVELRFV